MKLLIVTRCDGNIADQCAISHPFLRQYARKCGAKFQSLSHLSDCKEGDGRWHYRIMKFYELFDEYDRILHVDSDIIVMPTAPNVFNVVPEGKIGTVLEDKGSRREVRHRCIERIQKQFGDVGWKEGYINTGFFLASKCHREVFTKIDGRYYAGEGWDDVHLGYQMARLKAPVFELGFQWNHMTMFSESWNGSPNRFQSYILHYAGAGIFDPDISSRIEQMQKDSEIVGVV